MGAPNSGIQAADQPAGTLLDAFKTISDDDRARHEAVLNYWMSIRAERELPPLRDLDPLEISDAAPCSVLLELIGGGEDAEIRHLGETLKGGSDADHIAQAPRPSILASIARKLSIVAISRTFLAFEDEFAADGQTTRCWITLLPLSSAGAWVDYVYAFVSFAAVAPGAEAEASAEIVEDELEPVAEFEESAPEAIVETEDASEEVPLEPEDAPEEEVLELDSPVEDVLDESVAPVESEEQLAPSEPASVPPAAKDASFTFDAAAAGSGFYAKAVKVNPTLPSVAPPRAESVRVGSPIAAEPELPPSPKADAFASVQETVAPEAAEAAEIAEPQEPNKPTTSAPEGSLQSKLTDVRAKADEARMAKLRANAALYEGLSAAYDFALDAEDSPEEYLKLVEGQGLKIQLRSPMRPVVKLAFDGLCDDSTITQLEAVLAWAIDNDLPRGSLAGRIEEAGGIGPILSGHARAA